MDMLLTGIDVAGNVGLNGPPMSVQILLDGRVEFSIREDGTEYWNTVKLSKPEATELRDWLNRVLDDE